MQIAIIGANNQVGQAILKESLYRNYEVTAIIPQHTNFCHADIAKIERDLFQLTVEDLRPFQIIINAFYAPPGSEFLYQSTLSHLTALLTNLPYTRLFMVGDASSLYLDEAHTVRVMDTALYPAAYRNYACQRANALQQLQHNHTVNWTYLSPAVYFNSNGARTGQYQLAGEKLTYSHNGESEISFADYAVAMLDMINEPYIAQRHLSVVAA